MYTYALSCLNDLLASNIGITQRDIVVNTISKQEYILQHGSYMFAQRSKGEGVDIHVIYINSPCGKVVETIQQVGNSSFTSPRSPYYSYCLAVFYFKSNSVQNLFTGYIFKMNIFKTDRVLNLSKLLCTLFFGIGIGIEDSKDTF